MSQGHSMQVGLLAVNRAFSRFAHVTGYVCVSGAFLAAFGYQSGTPKALIWPVLPLLAITLALLIILDRRRTAFFSVLFLAAGGITQYVLSVVLLSSFPSVQSGTTLVFSLVTVSMVLVCGPGFVPSSTIVWGTIGFAIAQAASIGAALTTRSAFHIAALSIVVEVGLVLVELTDGITRGRRMAASSEFDRAALDDELSALRYRTEVRAAALMHDTVLGHLSAIATAADGALSQKLKSQMQADIEMLTHEDWWADPAPESDDRGWADWRRSALLAAVHEARELSLEVEVTGDPAAVGRLTPELDSAVGLAAKQCLVNVLRHADVDHAEVVVIGSESDVAVMVIDAGRGFSEHLIASDRLGLRQSVRRRIESVGGEVQLWSTPGRGTSVLIRVPAAPVQGLSDE